MLGKLSALLSDEESMQQLSELAKMIQEADGTAEDSIQADSETEKTGEAVSGFDFAKLLQLQSAFSGMQEETNDTALLLALRPHLNEARQAKVDKAVRVLKLYAVFTMLKESGMLSDLI